MHVINILIYSSPPIFLFFRAIIFHLKQSFQLFFISHFYSSFFDDFIVKKNVRFNWK